MSILFLVPPASKPSQIRHHERAAGLQRPPKPQPRQDEFYDNADLNAIRIDDGFASAPVLVNIQAKPFQSSQKVYNIAIDLSKVEWNEFTLFMILCDSLFPFPTAQVTALFLYNSISFIIRIVAVLVSFVLISILSFLLLSLRWIRNQANAYAFLQVSKCYINII